jgi:hypothetical protein
MNDAASLIGGWALAVCEGRCTQAASVYLTKEGILSSGGRDWRARYEDLTNAIEVAPGAEEEDEFQVDSTAAHERDGDDPGSEGCAAARCITSSVITRNAVGRKRVPVGRMRTGAADDDGVDGSDTVLAAEVVRVGLAGNSKTINIPSVRKSSLRSQITIVERRKRKGVRRARRLGWSRVLWAGGRLHKKL